MNEKKKSIKLSRVISVPTSEALARERAVSYFTASLYTRVNDITVMAFKRGSIKGSLLSISPLGWYCITKLKFMHESTELKIIAELELKEVSRILFLLPWNKVYWSRQLSDLETFLIDGVSLHNIKLMQLDPLNLTINIILFLIVCIIMGIAFTSFYCGIGIVIANITGFRDVDIIFILACVSLPILIFIAWKYDKWFKAKIEQTDDTSNNSAEKHSYH